MLQATLEFGGRKSDKQTYIEVGGRTDVPKANRPGLSKTALFMALRNTVWTTGPVILLKQ